MRRIHTRYFTQNQAQGSARHVGETLRQTRLHDGPKIGRDQRRPRNAIHLLEYNGHSGEAHSQTFAGIQMH